jgi:23S rRNA (adenine2503-C2)-methyltransferase
MSTLPAKVNLLDYGSDALKELFATFNEKPYRADQVIAWMHKHDCHDIEAMTNLSKSCRQFLLDKTTIIEPELALVRPSDDGTCKFLIRLYDGNLIETVYIPEKTRATLCVSSQVGCALNCDFCATGKEGFNRNLTLSEIISQLQIARRWAASNHVQAVTNVVFMGMGEPLLNYAPVLESIKLMLSDNAYGLSKYKVTLSTSGVLPFMVKLKADIDCALAISLHAPNDVLRTELVPINKKYPLKELMAVCKDYFENQPRRKVTFEYVMLAGVNDQLEHAKQLAQLVKDVPCKMNLIPFNSFTGTRYTRSPDEQVLKFQDYLIQKGIDTWIRKTRGDSVAAACGQLAGDIKDRTGRHERWLKTSHVTIKKQEGML